MATFGLSEVLLTIQAHLCKKLDVTERAAERKRANPIFARLRLHVLHIIGRLKVFCIQRYWSRRKNSGLRFNLIASIYNFEFGLYL